MTARTLTTVAALALVLAGGLSSGCTRGGRAHDRFVPAGGASLSAERTLPTPAASAAPAPANAAASGPRLYDGATGTPTTLDTTLARWRGADVVLFGEVHDDLAVARVQRAVLERMLAQERPVALAMEFFERDQQPLVDRWLRGGIDDETFRRETKRSPSYEKTHGPLMALAKERGVAVIAANAPRRLVTAWRKSEHAADAAGYEAWRASLPAEEQSLVPREWSAPKDGYWESFRELMGERAGPFFRSQTLWDDAMAEAVADHRARNPDTRVLLVVGGFHVAARLGTVTKLRLRRPSDRVTVLYASRAEGAGTAFDPADRGQGDAVLRVPSPPRTAPAAVPAAPPHPAAGQTTRRPDPASS
jgi:uncharacterized iron-regulated protein